MADQAAAQDIAHELLAVVPALHNDNGVDVHPLMPAAANNEQQLHQEGPEPLMDMPIHDDFAQLMAVHPAPPEPPMPPTFEGPPMFPSAFISYPAPAG